MSISKDFEFILVAVSHSLTYYIYDIFPDGAVINDGHWSAWNRLSGEQVLWASRASIAKDTIVSKYEQ